MSCSVNVRDVNYTCESKSLLENINLNVGHEEKVAVVGANGSGKSTLLKIIAGLIPPSSGYIEIFHDKMNSLKEFRKYRSDIGYLPQDVSNHFLCPTVIEDVMFALRAKGISKDESYEKAIEVLESLNIKKLENRIIHELSGGEQKIVALAGILITKPKILLLDEPTNDLDEKSENTICEILNSINKSMIIVSHHKSFIDKLTLTIYRLNKSLIKE
jgi:cobalt/nickel transport system ATP-binding protein